MQDLTGRAWGRFQIIEERGRGGMAVVYRAYDMVLQRTVALKVLQPVLAANEDFNRRFRREAITAANLRHPGIVVIYDVGEHDSFQYIVMEFLEGPTLQQEVQDKGPMPVPRAVSILGQLAAALDYAHQQGLIHRDVKPANVMLGPCDHVTLTDFGLVKAVGAGAITGAGTASGTLNYMSPEQAMGREMDYRSDIYSLGVVAYEMMAGEVPFSANTPYQALRDLIHEPPPSLSRLNTRVPGQVEQVVFRALAKEPERRYGTAAEFARTLAAVAGCSAAVEGTPTAGSLRRNIALQLTTADGRQYPVYWGEVTIGRDTGNDIILPVSQVSRRHARLDSDRQGCRIVDLGSTNGTLLNGIRLEPGAPHELRPEDVLEIGPVRLLAAGVVPSGDAKGTETLAGSRR